MSGVLYLCPTPIGNLEDMTIRAIRVLKEVDIIAAEDTRRSKILCNHYHINNKLISYHEHNKISKGKLLIEKLNSGLDIALVTDAGTPGISDPGEDLVRLAYENDIEVTVLPGAVAATTALVLSGLSTRRFCFEAFLPVDNKERKDILNNLINEVRTIIIYEAPHKLKRTLEDLYKYLGNRNISITKELTKKYENVFRTNLEEAIEYYKDKDIKGEFVLVIEGKSLVDIKKEEIEKWEEYSMEEHLSFYINKGYDKKESMKKVAKDRGISKREVYKHTI